MTIASLTTTPATPAAASKGAASPTATATPDIQVATPTPAIAGPADLQRALIAVRQSAAVRQDGLAILMANLMQVSGKLPPPLQTALDQLIALHLPTDTAPDAATVKTAVENSGLFTEAKLAGSASSEEIAADVKVTLLRLNQAAERWLADSRTSALAGTPTADPKPLAADARASTVAAKATQAGTPRPPPTSTNGAARPTAAAMKPDALAQTARLSGETALAAAVARPTTAAAKTVTPTQPRISTAAPSPTASGVAAGPIDTELPVDLKNALLLLGKAAAVWMARAAPDVPDVQPVQQTAASAMPASNAPTPPATRQPIAATAGSSAPVRQDQPAQPEQANTPSPPSSTVKPPLQPAPNELAPAAKQPDRPFPPTGAQQSRVTPTEPPPSKLVAPPPANVPTDDMPAQSVSPEALPPVMQSVRQMTQAMLSFPRADVPPELKAILFTLSKTADGWLSNAATQSGAEAAPLPGTPKRSVQGDAGTGKPAAPQATAPQVAAPRTAAPQTATPQNTAPRSAAPQTAEAQTAGLQTAKPQTPKPQTAAPQAAAPQTAASSPSAASAIPNDLKTVLLLLNKAAEIWFTDDAPAQSTPADPRSSTPSVPPPVPGAPGKAQPAALATLPENADALLTASKLVTGSDAALARQTLLQIASLPDATPQARGPEARWLLDIPLMTPQGSAVAQLIIERDGSNASAETPQPVWRVQFAIDIEPLGPVRANLAMSGERAWVTIAADRPESLEKLRSGASWLSDALQATELNADIAFQSGTAPDRKAGGRRLVDHAL